MQRVSYMGDGSTTEFTFNFPFYENTNIIVTKNGATATGYTIVGTSAGLNADIPYTGGKVVFNVAPIATDSITISRRLPLTRIVDYQPTEKINPTVLNQDQNYTMEALKDMQDNLDGFDALYSEIISIESIQTLTNRIETVSQQITNLGNISQLRQTVNNLVQNPVHTIPDYAGTKTALSTDTNTWITIPKDGVLHIKFMTTNAVSWLSICIGTETNNTILTTQVNTDARSNNVLYNVKSGQKFKMVPQNANITTCEIIPFC